MYEHVIWDWNGTLLDDIGLCIDIANRMLTSRGKPGVTRQKYLELFDFPVKGYYERIGFNFSDEDYDSVCVEFCDEYDRRVGECRLRAHALDTLLYFRNAGISQSVLSATEQKTLERIVDSFGLTHFFESLRGQSDNRAAGKVARGRQLLEEQDLHGAQVLLVGDTTHDAEVAAEIKVDCMLVAGGHHPRKKLLETGRQVFMGLTGIMPVLL